MIFFIECIVVCALFTLIVFLSAKDPLQGIHNYPPAIIAKVKEMGLITQEQEPKSKAVIMKKLMAAVIIAVILGAVVYYINGARGFVSGTVTSYLIWLAADWYDALVIDIIWFCHSPRCVIPGTEDMTDAYHDYKFHIWGSVKGMLYGLPVCMLIGLIVQIIGMIR